MGCPVDRLEVLEFLTSSIEMAVPIVSQDNISILKCPVMTNPVLLQGLHIQDSNFDLPHKRNSKQHHLIAPEISPEQQMQVLFIRQWWNPPPALICCTLNPDTVLRHQGQVLILDHQLLVVCQEVDHHSPEISVRKIGGLP